MNIKIISPISLLVVAFVLVLLDIKLVLESK